MDKASLTILRLAVGVTTSVAISYGFSWPLYFITPIFTFMFLAIPMWMGARSAITLLFRLVFALFCGIIISEFFLNYPLVCIPLYTVLFFLIYYNDTPASPPMATLFMTLGVTLVPISAFAGAGVAPVVATYLVLNMAGGLLLAGFFHGLLSTSPPAAANLKADARSQAVTVTVPHSERIRLALVSTLVALAAVMIFFFFNLGQYALAMIYICIMAGTPNKNSSIKTLKANATATCIGGIAIIVNYNLLVLCPTYIFLIAVTFLATLLFARIIVTGGPMAPAFSSGFTTFLVLLGSSTQVDATASANFYLRIAQVLFAGLFTLVALMIVERLTRPKAFRILATIRQLHR
ncbi:DUF2955 domain-containing protein [Desulfosediminicola sp.]|uniref:DUF2955 domain-containing protein n=1 Tax=Desulfosediminicola sp. TaxID=2886825 RepID=UPI003AF2C682